MREVFVCQDDMDYSCLSDSSYKRSWDDLSSYRTFFTELYEFDVCSVDSAVYTLFRKKIYLAKVTNSGEDFDKNINK